jgi:hypothetical protein
VLISTVLIDKLVVTEIEVDIEVNMDVDEIVLRVGADEPIPAPELVREGGTYPVEPRTLALELDKGKGAELGVPETELGTRGVKMLPLPLLSPLPDAVTAVRLEELPMPREEVPVVNNEVDGLGGMVNG